MVVDNVVERAVDAVVNVERLRLAETTLAGVNFARNRCTRRDKIAAGLGNKSQLALRLRVSIDIDPEFSNC